MLNSQVVEGEKQMEFEEVVHLTTPDLLNCGVHVYVDVGDGAFQFADMEVVQHSLTYLEMPKIYCLILFLRCLLGLKGR